MEKSEIVNFRKGYILLMRNDNKEKKMRYRLNVSDNSKNKRYLKEVMEEGGYELVISGLEEVDITIWDESYGIEAMMKNFSDDILCVCGDRVYNYLKRSNIDDRRNIKVIRRPFTGREMMNLVSEMLRPKMR